MCIEYHVQVNMYHVSVQGIDERMINVHYCYYDYYYYYYYYHYYYYCVYVYYCVAQKVLCK